MNLRDYQTAMLADIATAFLDARAVLAVLPTGGGKTVLFAEDARRTPGPVLVVAHRRELIRQAIEKLHAAGVDAGPWRRGRPVPRVCVGSVQALCNAPLPPFRRIIIDEAHHAIAATYLRLLKQQPQAQVLGVTATPLRGDGRGLGSVFQTMVRGPTTAELVAAGFLVPCATFAPSSGPNLAGVRTLAGEFNAADLAGAMDKPTITGDAVEHYERHAAYVPAIAFCTSVEHAQHTAAAFRAEGWRSVAVHGNMAEAERDAAIAGLATGAVQVLASCSLIDEGLDVPRCGCVIDLAPTLALGRYRQRGGRGMRTAPGKTGMVYLDHAGNALRHGLFSFEPEWTLDGAKRRFAAPPVAQCPACYAMHEPGPRCPACGHDYQAARAATEARRVAAVMGELAELTAEDMRLRHLAAQPLALALKACRTRGDVATLAHARGLDGAWINRVATMRRLPDVAYAATGGREFF